MKRASDFRFRVLVVVFVLAVVQLTAPFVGSRLSADKADPQPGPDSAIAAVRGGEVRGSVLAGIAAPTNTFVALGKGGALKVGSNPYVFLPDIPVYLQDVKTSAKTPVVITDLDGTFTFPALPQAQYRLCWKPPGYVPDCDAPFVLRTRNITLKPVVAYARPDVVFGRSTLKDGIACRFVAPFLGVNTWTNVTGAAPSGTRRVRVNNNGEYVIPAFARGESVNLTATCEGAKTTASVTVASYAVMRDLTFTNTQPKIQLASANAGGRFVRSVANGTTVKVNVQAKTGIAGLPLHYRWAPFPRVAGFGGPDAPGASWKVAGRGQATMFVLARDGQGGNVLSRVTLSTQPNQIMFSGRVTANDAPAVSGATVSINGRRTVTNAGGAFLITLTKEQPRYVVVIEKLGYRMLSRALYAPATDATFRLYRADDRLVDPTKPIDVTERPPKETRNQTGIRLELKPNSLAQGADGKGPLATTPLHVQASSYDLHDPNDQMPGDFGGTDSGGKAYRLGSFGAADVEFRDGAGNRFNLAPGRTAAVHMPIDPAQLASAPATIPFWHYDTERGLWVRDGNATRAGNEYVVDVTHFSAVNMDVAFTNAACTRITVDTGIMAVPFRLRMTPVTGNFTIDGGHQDQIVSDGLNVVVREPPNVQVKFDVIDSEGNVVVGASQTINTGNASASGVMWNPPPNPPYADCQSDLVYDVHTVQARYPASFLTFRTPTSPAANNYLDPVQGPILANQYYTKIDPGGTKTAGGDTNDFAHWKTQNGFDRTGETHVVYQNEYDLGFGRDMHMQTGGQTGACVGCVAYYVTNYDDVEAAVNGVLNNGAGQKQTVAMEYSPQTGTTGSRYTKFYVYNADGTISNSATLDQFGAKVVPTLCIICHSGNIASMGSNGDLLTARFIPFDLESFRYHPTNATYSRGTQESSFRELNRGIDDLTNVTAQVKLLITHWYGNEGDTALPNLPFSDVAVPSGWTSPTDESHLYNAVIKPSCRSCHTTRDSGSVGGPPTDISWQDFAGTDNDSAVIRPFVCGSHVMPQAQRTFARFWLGTAPNGPATLASSDLSAFASPNNTCN